MSIHVFLVLRMGSNQLKSELFGEICCWKWSSGLNHNNTKNVSGTFRSNLLLAAC